MGTVKDIRKQLDELAYNETRLKSLMAQAEQLRSLAEKATANFSHTGSHKTGIKGKREDVMAKLADIEILIQEEANKLYDSKYDMLVKLAGVHDSTSRTLLELRYMERKTWEEIATELSYTPRWVFTLHNRALKELAKVK